MVKNSPDWVSESIFYHIYPLGYCNSEKSSGSTPFGLARISENLQQIREMGFNAIYLGPLFQSESHGYDTTDFFNVDGRLGSNDDLKALVRKCHEYGIKVVLDGVFNHTGRSFFAFRELLNSNGYGEYSNWYCDVAPNNSEGRIPFGYSSWNGHKELPKLNLKYGPVKKHLFDAVEFWIREFETDGIRLDAADCLDFDFMRDLRRTARALKEDFWLMGEVIHGNYAVWANENTLNSVTNYECYKGLYSSFNDKNFFEIAYSLNRQFAHGGIYENLLLYNFADNHDVSRIYSILQNKIHIHPLYILLFTMPGIPSVYYGSEYGHEGCKNSNSDWNLRPDYDTVMKNAGDENKHIAHTLAKLSDIRKKHLPLMKGTYKQLYVNHMQFVFEREYFGNRMVAGINSQEKTFRGTLDGFQDGTYFDLLNGMREFRCENGRLNYEIYPNWGMILVKK